jgi:hypothetical protein
VVGAVVGAAAGSLGFPKTITKVQTQTQTVTSVSTTTATGLPATWDLTADVVVIGAGAAGMVAALAAQAKGASVIVVEMNYDVGGHAITSGGMVDLGGGTASQQKWSITDSADLVYQDLTSPVSTSPSSGAPPLWGSYGGPYQDRAMSRTFADNNVAAYNFLQSMGIQWQELGSVKIGTSHWNGASHTPRTNYPMWKGAVTNPPGQDSPAGNDGVAYIRPLEITARNNGIQFLLNYRMSQIYRAGNYTGRVVGVSANYTGGRTLPGSTALLQPYCTTSGSLVPNKGNISMTQATVNIKANKAVFVATGGSSSNIERRKRFDQRLGSAFSVGGEPYSYQTGDGEVAAERIGASLYAPGNENSGECDGTGGAQITVPGYIGSQYEYRSIHWVPACPLFPLARAGGLSVSNYQDVIHVNADGNRFFDETQTGAPMYAWIDAALCPTATTKAPEWSSGPVWAIFDSAAVTRESWTLGSPNTDPTFFFQGNDIPTLVQGINSNQFQTTPMNAATLQAAITRYNGFVDAGKDSDFGKPAPKYKINTPPYYAAYSSPTVHDWLTGLRIDSGAHVLDVDANVIPGLFAAGESVGGMVMHGLAKCATFGMIGGTNAALGT